ncbi:hypothetical protein Efla_004641 [Eimeria flavescens]
MAEDGEPKPLEAMAELEGAAAVLPPSHPLLRGAQEALRQQLKRQLEAVNQQLRESNAKAREVDTEHSELGQQLYEAQNRLRGFQLQIKNLSAEEEEARKKRTASEDEMQKATEQLRAEETAVTATREKLIKSRGDYNELKYALQRAEAHTAKLEDAIKLKRRQLYKDSESLRKQELQKMRQDFFLDRLHGQLQELLEEKDILLAQLKAQEADLELSRNAIQECQGEIEDVVSGKQQLLVQLNTCMQGLEIRSRAEFTIKEAIQAEEAKADSAHSDVRDLERTTQELQEANETLTLKLNSTRCQLNGVRTQIGKVEDTQSRMREQLGVLTASLTQAENDAKKTEALAAKLSHQREVVIRDIQDYTQACGSLTDQIFEALANQASVTRAGAVHHKASFFEKRDNLMRAITAVLAIPTHSFAFEAFKGQKKIHFVFVRAQKTKSLLQECENREAELVKVDFEKAQLLVESVGVRAAIASTDEDIAALEAEVKEKEKLSDQERHTQHLQAACPGPLVELNCCFKLSNAALEAYGLREPCHWALREYDAKRSAPGEGSSSTLDVMIRSFKNQLAETANKITELQQSWIKKQTELIKLQAKIGEKREELAAKKDELLVRKQRNLRIIGEVDSTKRDIKTLNAELKELQHLIDRMGRQLVAFKEEQAKFESEAAAIQGETELQLAEKEKRKQELLANLEKTQKERDAVLEELVDLERQVMLWERKIVLEKEMQSAIDPSVGQASHIELTTMKKEIHRMELQEMQLKKTQEHLLHQLNQMLTKRDMIRVHNEPKARGTKEAHQKLALQRQVTSLDAKLKEVEEQGATAEDELKNATEDFCEVGRPLRLQCTAP